MATRFRSILAVLVVVWLWPASALAQITATWANSYGTAASTTTGKATAVDGSGNVYVAGYFGGASLTIGATTLTRIGTQDVFVAKLDSSGTAVWAKNFGGAGASVLGNAVAVDGSGNVYIGGSFQSANLTVGATTLTRVGISDVFVAKLDSSGTPVWARNYGGAGTFVTGTAIAVDGSGNVYAGGYFSAGDLTVGGTTRTRMGNQDAFALKLDSSGTPVWTRNYGGAGASVTSQAIAVDGSGNLHVGAFWSGAALTTPSLGLTGAQDVFALKLDSSGATTWYYNIVSISGSTTATGIAVDGSGNVYVGGYFQGGANLAGALTRIGTIDAFVYTLNSSGATIWYKNFGGAGASAESHAIAVDGSGNVYLGGFFSGANLTTPALTRIGTQDAFVFKMDSSAAAASAKNFGGAGASADSYAIAVDGSGNAHLGGNFSNANLTTPALTLIGTADAFIIKAATVQYALTVTTSGTGTVASSPAGISCGATCSANFATGTSVTLTATAGAGHVFSAWSGDCSGSGTATLSMTAARSCTATFTPLFALTVTTSGTGTVTSAPAGISCGSTCSADFVSGTSVTLTATAGAGHTFSGWSGACSGSGTATVSMTQVRACTATFTLVFALTVTISGTGTVASSPAGISCGSTCSADFEFGTSVTLTATTGAGYFFSAWSGACAGSGTATLSMTQARACTAIFALTRPSWLGTNGNGQINFSRIEVTQSASGQASAAIPPGNFNASGLTYTARQADGSPLPSWLTFDSATLSFTLASTGFDSAARAAPSGPVQPLAVAASSGRWLVTAPVRVAARLTIALQVSDPDGRSATVTFPFVVYSQRSQATVVAVSVTDTGASANGAAAASALSDDGQAVVFQVTSTNLVPEDSDSTPEVFRYDVASGVLDRFSTGSFMGAIAGPAQGWSGSPAISADARIIAFASDAANVGTVWNFGPRQVWIADASSARVSTVTPSPSAASAAADGTLADGASDNPSLSETGRHVAFESEATNLVAGTSTAVHRIYVKDRTTGAVVLAGTGRRPSIAGDGGSVAFDDETTVYRKDLILGAVVAVGSGTLARLSRDGRYVVWQSGGSILRADLSTSATATVAEGSAPAMSADGRFVAYISQDQVRMRDMAAGTDGLVSTATGGGGGNGASSAPAISGDGRFVSFASAATDLVANMTGTQLFVAGNPLLAPLATGWWWNPGEPGRGFAVETRGDRLMLGTLLYASDGSPVWYLASGAVSSTSSTLALQQYAGGQTLGGAYRVASALGSVGTATLAISSRSDATAFGALSTSLQRFEFSSGGVTAGPQLGSPEGGWWWNSDGPGTGWYLEIQNATLFLAGFLYDAGGNATWVWAAGSMSTTRTFTGTLSRCTGGQTLGGTYQTATCTADQGTVSLAFSSPIEAAITLPTGGRIALGRFRF